MSAPYEIQTLANGQWTNDPTHLGHGCTSDDNRWPTKAEALAAVDDLAACGFDRRDLRVVPCG
jgi:hypothetical protein